MVLHLLSPAHLSVFPESHCSSSLLTTAAPKRHSPHPFPAASILLPQPQCSLGFPVPSWKISKVVPVSCVASPPLPCFQKMQLSVILQLPLSNQVPMRKEEVAADCGMGLPSTGARVQPVPIIHLLVLGEGESRGAEWSLLPSPFPVLQCFLCSVRL